MAADRPPKVYPATAENDVEAPPPPPPASTAPLIPPNSPKSSEATPLQPSNVDVAYPPAPPRNIAVSYLDPPKRRSGCCGSCLGRCLCCILSVILVALVIVGILVAVFFLAFQPKLPHYSVNTLRISSFNLASNGALSATFEVNVTAINPNHHIGIYYLSGSNADVWYEGQELSQGTLPVFYQGHENTTVLDVSLSGQTNNGTALVSSAEQELKENGGVGLEMRARVKVKVKLGKLKLMKMKFKVHCYLVVDSLQTETDIGVSSSSCHIKPIFI